MNSFFLLRDDGRWDFTHSSIRTGILKTVTNKKKLHRQILEYLKKLDKYDEVRISEIIYHCWGADDQRYFVQYISIYEEEKDIIGPASKVSYETAMLDNGNWLSAVINNENRCIANHKFMIFLNYQLYANSHFLRTAGPYFPDSPGHIKRTAWDISRAEGTPPY